MKNSKFEQVYDKFITESVKQITVIFPDMKVNDKAEKNSPEAKGQFIIAQNDDGKWQVQGTDVYADIIEDNRDAALEELIKLLEKDDAIDNVGKFTVK